MTLSSTLPNLPNASQHLIHHALHPDDTGDTVIVLAHIPDIETGRRLYDLGDLDEQGIVKALYHLRKQQTGKTQLPPYLYTIRAVLLCEINSQNPTDPPVCHFFNQINEKQLLQDFLQYYSKQTRRLISWQGAQLDFPNLHYRLLKHGFSPLAPKKQLSLYDQLSPFPQLAAHDKPSLYASQCLFDLPIKQVINDLDDNLLETIWQAHLQQNHKHTQQQLQQQANSIVKLIQQLSHTLV
jgi:hypothetical protein